MDFLKAQAQKIREQLAGLTPSQRMLAGSLVVIMLMTLIYWSRYASTAEMQDVLGQDMTPEDIANVSRLIESRGIEHKTVGNRIQVPADRRLEVLGILTFEGAGPRDTSVGFDDIIAKMDSPWNTHVKEDQMFTRAKEALLGQVLRTWQGVRDAQVIINNVTRRAFGDEAVAPSATVNLRLRDNAGKPAKKMIKAAADVITGAVAGMVRNRVKVIINGASYSVRDDDQDGGDDWMDLVKESEQHFTQKILDHFGNIDGLMVSVTVDPKMQQRQIEKEHYDKAGTFDKPISIDEKTEETSSNSRGPSEPGVVPNTGANQAARLDGAAPGAGGEGSTSSTTSTQTKNQIFPSVTREWIKDRSGSSAVVGASINVPRSYFIRIYKTINPNAKDPDRATLQPVIDAELANIKSQALGCISNTPPDKVDVAPYFDFLPMNDSLAQPAAASSLPLAITGNAREIALGVLAVISLFMVSMMVRKASPAPVVIARQDRPVPQASTPVDLATEVNEGIQTMDGMEVDDDSIRTQQIIGQVSNMVKENPDSAANLVKRWLNRP
jgi:flagellar biosynthesis/type III secretory pathway M-ring protein FliF/YscJ